MPGSAIAPRAHICEKLKRVNLVNDENAEGISSSTFSVGDGWHVMHIYIHTDTLHCWDKPLLVKLGGFGESNRFTVKI